MVDRGNGGAIVMISSLLSFRAADKSSIYDCSKAALDQFTRCLALELGPHKVRPNCVSSQPPANVLHIVNRIGLCFDLTCVCVGGGRSSK